MVLCACIEKGQQSLGYTNVFNPVSVELGNRNCFFLPLDQMLVHDRVTPLPPSRSQHSDPAQGSTLDCLIQSSAS